MSDDQADDQGKTAKADPSGGGRRNGDRRETQAPFVGPDRRRGDRRAGGDRRASLRRDGGDSEAP
jgi:hypothetical protein